MKNEQFNPIADKYYTSEELANTLGVDIDELSRLDREGIGPPRFKMGMVVLYPKRAALDWVQYMELETMPIMSRTQRKKGG